MRCKICNKPSSLLFANKCYKCRWNKEINKRVKLYKKIKEKTYQQKHEYCVCLEITVVPGKKNVRIRHLDKHGYVFHGWVESFK